MPQRPALSVSRQHWGPAPKASHMPRLAPKPRIWPSWLPHDWGCTNTWQVAGPHPDPRGHLITCPPPCVWPALLLAAGPKASPSSGRGCLLCLAHAEPGYLARIAPLGTPRWAPWGGVRQRMRPPDDPLFGERMHRELLTKKSYNGVSARTRAVSDFLCRGSEEALLRFPDHKRSAWMIAN